MLTLPSRDRVRRPSIRNPSIRGNEASCSFPPRLHLPLASTSAIENALVACFDTTAGPLEYFGSTVEVRQVVDAEEEVRQHAGAPCSAPPGDASSALQ